MEKQLSLHQIDPYAWFSVQANFIKNKNFKQLDTENLYEELLEMGESFARELESNLVILFCHLLKWEMQPAKRSKSWIFSIIEHKKRVLKRLSKTPSLKYRLFDIAQDAWPLAIIKVSNEIGIDADIFPKNMWFDLDQFLNTEQNYNL